MIKTFISIVLSCLFFTVATPLFAGGETLILDPKHSYILWHIEHLGFSSQAGKWYVNGTVTLDKDNPQQSKVSATIKIADLITGIPDLDNHLKGPLFFDIEKFPNATFVSDKIDVLSKNTAKIHGMLNLHGVTKPIVLEVTLNKVGKNPITDKMSVGFTGTTLIKRSDFGMKTLLPEVGDEVKIEIEAEAYLPR